MKYLPAARAKTIIRAQITIPARGIPYSLAPSLRRVISYWTVILKVSSVAQDWVSSCVGQSGLLAKRQIFFYFFTENILYLQYPHGPSQLFHSCIVICLSTVPHLF